MTASHALNRTEALAQLTAAGQPLVTKKARDKITYHREERR